MRHVIKYLGSKRRLVQTIAALASGCGAVTAADLFTGTTRVAQELKRQGAFVTAVDTATYSEVLAQCYIGTDATAVDRDEIADAIVELDALPGRRGYFTEVFCERSRYLRPENGERVDAIRDAIEERHRSSWLYPILLTSLLEAADRVDSTTGLQMAYLKQWAPRSFLPLLLKVPELLAGPGRRDSRRRPPSGVVDRPGRLRLSRPALQPAPVLHQLPRLGDPDPLGRARPLRSCVQEGGLEEPRHPERLQFEVDDVRGLGRHRQQDRRDRDGGVVQ